MAMIQNSSRGTIVGTIYSSGSVAAGAAIDSGVLDLSPFREIEVFVDNTAGTVLRDLAMLSYLDDGTTLIDSIVLRRCGFGTAPAGSVYAPGAIRGYVGPNPPGGTSGTHVLYDATTAAGGALDSGGIFCEDADQVVATFIAAGAAGAASTAIREVDDAGVEVFFNNLSAPGINVQTKVAWTRGSLTAGLITGGGANNPAYYFSARRVRIMGTGGAASTVRLILTGHGRTPGTFAQQMILPTKAKLTLAAGGAGAARLTVIAR